MITGKTYSLYSGSETSDFYYNEIKLLVDSIIEMGLSPDELLNEIRETSISIQSVFKRKEPSKLSYIETDLNKYLSGVDFHLKNLKWKDKFGSTLNTKEITYYYYMIEIELVNRINRLRFLSSEVKYAFLPHCLRDLSKKCEAENDGFDLVCKGCSNQCYLNRVSVLLRRNDIYPYIWIDANLKKFIKNFRKNKVSLGILGIACIPELVSGLRRCDLPGVTAVGVPLDANRCRRWMGDFYDNSVNLKQLKLLLRKT